MNDVVIVAAKRTPLGGFGGGLSTLSAPELAAISNKALLDETGLSSDAIDEVIFGCVLQAGLGQAPARQGARLAGINDKTPATTINKMCGSGMKALMLGVESIKAGTNQVVLCGGMESMSNAPYLSPKSRFGARMGHAEFKDSMFLDGLEDAYDKGQLMGVFADRTAAKFNFSRQEQDAFAKSSLEKALKAQETGAFNNEIVNVTVKSRKGEITVSLDEGPDPAKIAKISKLKAAFAKDGTVTAANSSSISDGAASILIMSREKANELGLTPLATIKGQTSYAQAPEWFTTAPVGAMNALFEKTGWQSSDVDLYEINEAFAVVTMAAMRELALDESKVNVHGGACALGHPIGASGARIITTLVHALKTHHLKRGIASLCIGGGEATALAIEMD
jgi:acetyl-CoA C-acetyltransferase